MNNVCSIFCVLSLVLFSCKKESEDTNVRKQITLDSGWNTVMLDSLPKSENEFVRNIETDSSWKSVSVPHNWDQYYGYRRMSHGNLHGTAWYQKTLELDSENKGKQHFLFFEGVGSYATVWVNGIEVGGHKGGRTTFTINITDAIDFDKTNSIVVKAAHPSFIADLPWVCGGCSGEWGFSEGSQPLGIFRPVSLVVTHAIRIEPFGVHIWNAAETAKEKAVLNTTTEIQNYGNSSKAITVVNILRDQEGKQVAKIESELVSFTGSKEIDQQFPEFKNPKLWSPENPYLYELQTQVFQDGKLIDELKTPYGIRWISWPLNRDNDDNRFYLNDAPVFINGTCEYEHEIGKSHSFSDAQIKTRISQIKAAGFNAFREAHQPHNLKYQELLDEEGILFWSQFSAHIWYDTPEFKENFKTLLREWIKERRNNPSVVMWGLQNESTIPKEFAEECTQIIREMDPTTSSQRIVTTCNGGKGTDWNVIQNWSGTYGGDPYNYSEELSEQLLNGEYGAWRTADLHTEGEFDQDGALSEDRFAQLMEIKVREAEAVNDKVAGQFNWLFASHENPGRTQNGEGYREIDKVGPVNYKGLFTIWGEPLDAYYMYRANYVSKGTSPMVYIVSHSWPNRWEKSDIKDGITVYSNCDEVELFNDVNDRSLGKLKNPGRGKHFQFDDVAIQYNVLYAVGYVDGKPVAKDHIVLNTLPQAPGLQSLKEKNTDILKGGSEYHYVYRVNSGGAAYTDSHGNIWSADIHKTNKSNYGSYSWTDDFEQLPVFYASQRRTFDPIKGTIDWELFQKFRYGADKLEYEFEVEDGEYLVELYFTEPWYGTGGGMDCEGWRVFDVAINDKKVLKDLDIWKEVGHDTALKKTVTAISKNGKISISFPRATSGQAIISAIAIASKNKNVETKLSAKPMLHVKANDTLTTSTWLDQNSKQYLDTAIRFTKLPSALYGADYIRFREAVNTDFSGELILDNSATVYVFYDAQSTKKPVWLKGFEKLEEEVKNTSGKAFDVYSKEFKKGDSFHFSGKDIDPNTAMFTLAHVPSYNFETEDNSRTIIKLEAEETTTTGEGIEKAFFKKSDYIQFTKATSNSITFEVNPGVANSYLLRYRFMNMNTNPVNAQLTIEDANGIKVTNQTIAFPPAGEKWKILNTTSGGFINAGTYKITLQGSDLKGLRIESFEFQ
ncbi:malectin domain-containing carbohydrate-binding protein [Leeuwenhoekiella marinoflava]|uniref:Glycosyl hydrolase family 2 n=2 Tax=Leeuwenhoekiella marinoflava TaxID=988 RepID=A0A4V1KSL8_9FLAO|nr:malectin domain-containing carbohydrate-binding protein [Leeuwenhoekiella marinoflava]RXG32188.1 putative protein DUF4982 [Leeuwenhoekiella marinoflava]SHE84057.1 protein of unknown function [Leeuwenhoekiella marinoflava DSM 3653]